MWRSILRELSAELYPLLSLERTSDHQGVDQYVMGLRGVWGARRVFIVLRLESNQILNEYEDSKGGRGGRQKDLRAASTAG